MKILGQVFFNHLHGHSALSGFKKKNKYKKMQVQLCGWTMF